MDELNIDIILKSLDKLARHAKIAAEASDSLQDKLRFVRLRRVAEDARSPLRLQYYEAEDAEQIARCHPSDD